MGQKSDTIYSESIRYFLAVQERKLVPGSDTVPADFRVPPDFDLKQAPPRFQQKVLRRMLENIIGTFEEIEDRSKWSETNVSDTKDGLIKVRSGFISLKENDNPEKDFKVELKAVNNDLIVVHGLLKDALSYVLVAISELADNKGKRTNDYFHSLEDCRDVMSDIKMHLGAWPE